MANVSRNYRERHSILHLIKGKKKKNFYHLIYSGFLSKVYSVKAYNGSLLTNKIKKFHNSERSRNNMLGLNCQTQRAQTMSSHL